MAVTLTGPRSWSMTRDADWNRIYKLVYRVQCDRLDGPATVLACPGLPQVGEPWLIDNDADLWAWCRPEVTITPVVTGKPNESFDCEFTFSSKPLSRCNDTPVEDPLLEPQRISGSNSRFQEEATHDRWNFPILNSAYEPIRGPKNEWDADRMGVIIEQNVALLQPDLLKAMNNKVNDRVLWGMPRRTIKCTVRGWERKYYGQCFAYYVRHLEFEIRDEGFDRSLLDEGNKVLNGKWVGDAYILQDIAPGVPPNYLNPTHFKRASDREGNPCRVVLNGFGMPASVIVGGSVFGTGYFVSLSDNNINNPLSGSGFWCPLIDPLDLSVWQAGVAYPRGSLATVGDDVYLALIANPPVTPPSAAHWELMNSTQDAGTWSAAATYGKGDYVVAPLSISRSAEGYRYVQKYDEANLLTLGIPVAI